MTALALALVACCAMVCGCYLARLRHEERDVVSHDAKTTRALVWENATDVDTRLEAVRKDISALRSEVDALNALAAARSM